MRAGRLRSVITIQTFTATRNELNDVVKSWTTFATIRADVEPERGGEGFVSRQTLSTQPVLIRARYLPGVTAGMRVLHGSQTYTINSVVNVAARGRAMELHCEVSNAAT